jgi:nitrite reductase/ring-hydroxylating ferredoxin subunit
MRIAAVSELPPPGEAREFIFHSFPVCVVNQGGRYLVVSGACPHKGGPLAEGELDGDVLACPWHGWQFRLADGQCLNRSGICLKTFALIIHGDDVFLKP